LKKYGDKATKCTRMIFLSNLEVNKESIVLVIHNKVYFFVLKIPS